MQTCIKILSILKQEQFDCEVKRFQMKNIKLLIYLNRRFRPIFKGFLLFISIGFVFNACIPQKRLKYLQTHDETDTLNSFILPEKPVYKIQPHDELYIKINSLDEQGANLYERSTESRYSMQSEMLYLYSYPVNDSGNVSLPFIGEVYLEGMTLSESQKAIEQALSSYLNKPTVNVKFINKFITILGEVNRPGKYRLTEKRITIYEAIGMAGDMTGFGNRKNVKLLREKDDESIMYTIDLTSKHIIESEHYYLMPNDVIYIEPYNIKSWGIKEVPYSVIFSTITTFLLILNYLN